MCDKYINDRLKILLTSSTRSFHASSNMPQMGEPSPKGWPNWISFLQGSFLLISITNKSPPDTISTPRLTKNAFKFSFDTLEYSSATAGLPSLIHTLPLL